MVGTCKASDKAVYSLRKAFPAPEDFKLFTPKRYKESEEGGVRRVSIVSTIVARSRS